MRDETYFENRKIGALVRFAFSDISIKALRGIHPRIADVYNSYSRNVNLAYDLARFPPVIAVGGLAIGLLAARAVYAEFGHFDPKKISKEQNDSIRLRMTLAGPRAAVRKQTIIRKTSSNFRVVLDRADKKTLAGLDAIMPSLVVFSWTAFESLCEDLLERAIDVRPRWLSSLKGRNEQRPSRPWEVSLKGNTVPTSKESKGPKSRDKLRYRNIKAIRDSYWITFPVGGRMIDRALEGRCIDTLFAVRNILVHRGGIADELFLKRVDGLPEFSHVKNGSLLRLDFGSVRSIIQPVLVRGIRLIAAVNKWIMEHPDDKSALAKNHLLSWKKSALSVMAKAEKSETTIPS